MDKKVTFDEYIVRWYERRLCYLDILSVKNVKRAARMGINPPLFDIFKYEFVLKEIRNRIDKL